MIVKLEREGRHLEDLPIVSASQTGIRWPPVPRPRTPFLARSHRGLHSPAFAAPIPPHALYNNGRAPPPSIPTLNCARFADLADDLAYVFAPPSLLGAVVCDVRSISQLKQVQITLETWRNSCQQRALGTFFSIHILVYVHEQNKVVKTKKTRKTIISPASRTQTTRTRHGSRTTENKQKSSRKQKQKAHEPEWSAEMANVSRMGNFQRNVALTLYRTTVPFWGHVNYPNSE